MTAVLMDRPTRVPGARPTTSVITRRRSTILLFATMPVVFIEPAPWDILIVGVLFLTLAADRLRLTATALVGLCAFWASTLTALLSTTDSSAAFGLGGFRYLVIEMLLSAAFCLMLVKFREGTWSVSDVIAGYCAGALLATGAVLALKYLPSSPQWIYRDEFRSRLKGTFKDPNVMGPFLILPLLIAIYGHRPFQRLALRMSAIVVLGTGLVLTYSRGAWVGLLVALMVKESLDLGSRWRLGALTSRLLLAIGALVLIISVDLPSGDRALGGRLAVQSYDSGRVDGIAEGLHLALDRPTGIGPTVFGAQHGTNPHNLFVAKATDAGVIAATVFAVLFLAAIHRLWVLSRASRAPMARMLLGTVVAHLLMSMVVYSHHWRHQLLILALALSGGAAQHFLEEDQHDHFASVTAHA